MPSLQQEWEEERHAKIQAQVTDFLPKAYRKFKGRYPRGGMNGAVDAFYELALTLYKDTGRIFNEDLWAVAWHASEQWAAFADRRRPARHAQSDQAGMMGEGIDEQSILIELREDGRETNTGHWEAGPGRVLASFPMTKAEFMTNWADDVQFLRPVEQKAILLMQQKGYIKTIPPPSEIEMDGDFMSNQILAHKGTGVEDPGWGFYIEVADRYMPIFDMWHDERYQNYTAEEEAGIETVRRAQIDPGGWQEEYALGYGVDKDILNAFVYDPERPVQVYYNLLDEVGELVGEMPEIIGGGGMGWFVYSQDGSIYVAFGFVGGPFGYTVMTSDGRDLDGGEMPEGKTTVLEMAKWMKERVNWFRRKYGGGIRHAQIDPGGLQEQYMAGYGFPAEQADKVLYDPERPEFMEEEDYYLVGKMAGSDSDNRLVPGNLGGNIIGWMWDLTGGMEVIFGDAGGPIGYQVMSDDQSRVIEEGSMPANKKTTAREMAHYLSSKAREFDRRYAPRTAAAVERNAQVDPGGWQEEYRIGRGFPDALLNEKMFGPGVGWGDISKKHFNTVTGVTGYPCTDSVFGTSDKLWGWRVPLGNGCTALFHYFDGPLSVELAWKEGMETPFYGPNSVYEMPNEPATVLQTATFIDRTVRRLKTTVQNQKRTAQIDPGGLQQEVMEGMKNPNCDGDQCLYSEGEVRRLHIGGGGGNFILCRACFNNEMQFRQERNEELGDRACFTIPKWEDLPIYDPEDGQVRLSSRVGQLGITYTEQDVEDAVRWDDEQEARIVASGRPLNDQELEVARRAGVASPEQVRISEVDRIEVPHLMVMRRYWGMSPPAMCVGHGIEFVHGAYRQDILRHELHHVAQYEQAGDKRNLYKNYDATENEASVASHGVQAIPQQIRLSRKNPAIMS